MKFQTALDVANGLIELMNKFDDEVDEPIVNVDSHDHSARGDETFASFNMQKCKYHRREDGMNALSGRLEYQVIVTVNYRSFCEGDDE